MNKSESENENEIDECRLSCYAGLQASAQCCVVMLIKMGDRPNTTPVSQDRKTMTFKARFSKISPFCMNLIDLP